MTTSQKPLRPIALNKAGDDLLMIDWNDGHHGVLSWNHLRANCPCAGCREEREMPQDPLRVLKPSEIPKGGPLKPIAMTPMGRYAYKIVWSDGHDLGIYTFETLRELCECETCRANTA